jgi:hypothetical protein
MQSLLFAWVVLFAVAKCPAGKYLGDPETNNRGSFCEYCPRGKYQPEAVDGAHGCEMCTAGK